MKRSLIKTCSAVVIAGACTPALAADSFSVEAAYGLHDTQLVRAAIQWDWDTHLIDIGSSTHLGGYWDLSLAAWRGGRHKNIEGKTQYFADIGLTPAFRLQSNDKRGLYAELAVGVHLFSQLYNNYGRKLSTAFQFGDHIGAGYVFRDGLDLSLRIQHFSNGSIKQPNSGADFAVLRVAYPF